MSVDRYGINVPQELRGVATQPLEVWGLNGVLGSNEGHLQLQLLHALLVCVSTHDCSFDMSTDALFAGHLRRIVSKSMRCGAL